MSLLSKSYKRIIQLEFNEISGPVVKKLVAEGLLPNFAKLMKQGSFLQTSSEQEYQHLEPWIQWITAHTGKRFSEHGVFRLGDSNYLQHPQIWETLDKHGISSAVISCMNAKRGDLKNGIFFPDPWSKNGETYPKNLQALWNLISAKVQAHAHSEIKLSDLASAIKICTQFKLPLVLYVKILKQLLRQKINNQKKWPLAGIFDEFLTEIFLQILKKYEFGFNALFLNSVAHYQHHYWRNFDKQPFDGQIENPDIATTDNPMLYGYQIYDRILGKVISEAEGTDTLVLVLSGLSQIPFVENEEQGGKNYYRLKNHNAFLEHLNLSGYTAYPLMSRDWQITHSSNTALQIAKKRLEKLYISGQPLFHITQNIPNFLFIETAVTCGLPSNIKFSDGNSSDANTEEFFKHFSHVAIKNGHHNETGYCWMTDPAAKNTGITNIPLTEIYQLNLQALGIDVLEKSTSKNTGISNNELS